MAPEVTLDSMFRPYHGLDYYVGPQFNLLSTHMGHFLQNRDRFEYTEIPIFSKV